MSADELMRRALEGLNEARDRSVELSLNVRFRPSSGSGGTHTPAVTAEEIALSIVEGNAMTRAYTHAIKVINDTYRQMLQPDDEKKPEPIRKEIY